MNPFLNSLLSGAVVTAVLWTGAHLAHAVAPPGNVPPNYSQTQNIGTQLQSGQANAALWKSQLLGQVANYDSFTPKIQDTAIVASNIITCKDAKGNVTFSCDFTVAGSGGNLMANSLLGGPAFADATQRAAALAFIQNMTNASPLPYPGDKDVYKDPTNKNKGLTTDGVGYFAALFKQLPVLTAVQHSLVALFADRDRYPGLAGQLPVGVGGAASVLEMLEYEASRRYMTPAWFDAMNSATDQAVLREIAFMLAFQNYMMIKQYEQSERMEALMVANVSVTNGLANSSATQSLPSTQKQSTQQTNSLTGS